MTEGQQEDEPGLGLDEVLAALNHDLLAAQNRPGESVGLGVREVEIELSVEISRRVDVRGEASAKWFVLSGSASGEGSRDRTNAHRITLTLAPTSSDAASSGATLPDPVADVIPE